LPVFLFLAPRTACAEVIYSFNVNPAAHLIPLAGILLLKSYNQIMKTKKITILHSNDMHGDFLAEEVAGKLNKNDEELIGGLALLSGYINKVRQEEENVLYVVSGDMVQGSLIDSDYKGISTIELMNYLAPDVVTLGNHEFDYGLPHLLFLEKMANFPIINANLYIKKYNKRLMKPYVVLKKAGFDILFTGIITDKVIDSIKMDKLVGSFVSLKEASDEVGRITNAYKNSDIDLTVLLTHIGLDSDKKLASMLKPEWGVDLIVGGHSHTAMEKPEKINNVLIVQTGGGTNFIGRMDIVVNDDTNSIVDYKWQLVEIDSETVKPDERLKDYVNSFKKEVDKKYNAMICKFAKKLTHPKREEETILGNLVADAFASCGECDAILLGSGSVRVKEMGPLVTLGDLMACFPYDDSISKYKIKGEQLKKMFAHFMREENRTGEGECYQVNSKVRAVYSDSSKKLISLKIDGKEVDDSGDYTVCIQGFHFNNSLPYLNISNKELLKNGVTVMTTSGQHVLEEYFRNNQNLTGKIEGRLIYQ
jgi:5'-nucleotidase / UDP-sugar diphosphatase